MRTMTLVLLLWVPAQAVADGPKRPISVEPVRRPVEEIPPLVRGTFGDDVTVHTDQRTNQLIMIGDRRTKRQVRKLIRRLDRNRRSRPGRIIVHRLQHQQAKDVKATLDALRPPAGTSSRQRSTRKRTRKHRQINTRNH